MSTHRESCGCPEYQRLSRRQFLATSGGLSVAAVSAPYWLPRVAFAQDYCSTRDVIIAIFLRGAADGLTMCVPHGDANYYAARPSLAVEPPDSSNPNRTTDLDGFFGLPPAMTALIPAYQAGNLLIVHATGSNDPSRSHFEAQRFMELGKPGDVSLSTGWLGRHVASVPPISPSSVLRAIGINTGLQVTLAGAPLALPIPNLDDFGLSGPDGTVNARMDAIQDMFAGVADPLRATAQTTQQTIELLNTIDFANYTPAGGAVYPDSDFGLALKSTAALIKADLGVEAIAIDKGGWDTHASQGPITGTMADLMSDLAGGMAALHADLWSGNGRNVTLVVISEFGRRVAQNGASGTDHGHGNCMLVLGNNITGGRILTQWPGLAPGQLFENRDLEVTIDYRDVLAEIVSKRLGNSDLGFVFPGFTPTFRGVTTNCSPAGDLNCDGQTNFADIDPFVLALSSQQSYQAAHPTCNFNAADVNNDGQVNFDDIDPFVAALGGQAK